MSACIQKEWSLSDSMCFDKPLYPPEYVLGLVSSSFLSTREVISAAMQSSVRLRMSIFSIQAGIHNG